MYKKLIKWWLTGILFYFPFVSLVLNSIKNYSILSKFVVWIDEITIVICFLIGLRELYKNKEILNRSYLIIAIPIIAFCLYGLMSGIINRNSLIITILGTFDYIKYFLVIFIYAAFFREVNDFQKIFRLLLMLAILLSGLAITEEIWALVFRYILGRDLLDPGMYLLGPPQSALGGAWRLGILKAGSIIQRSDFLGYFSLLMFTIYIFLKRKINPWIYVSLIGGILSTAARSAYSSFFLLLIMVFILRKKTQNKKLMVILVVVAIVITGFLSIILPNADNLGDTENNPFIFRDYARNAGIKIWSDSFLIGNGPGMFGGVVSMIFASKIYRYYNFNFKYMESSIGGIDQFWPQVFAEVGIIGFILFACMIMSVLVLLFKLRREAVSNDIKDLQTGLLVFLMTIYVYTLGTGFNTTGVIFPYFAFIGISLGYVTDLKRMKMYL